MRVLNIKRGPIKKYNKKINNIIEVNSPNKNTPLRIKYVIFQNIVEITGYVLKNKPVLSTAKKYNIAGKNQGTIKPLFDCPTKKQNLL